MIKELLKSVGKKCFFQYMVLEEYKIRASSLQHIQRQILDILKGKCKENYRSIRKQCKRICI